MNRFIQTHYRSEQPNNYNGYMGFSIVPIERALAPVLSEVYQFNHDISVAESLYHSFSTYKLTKDESAAVYLYTIELGEKSLHHMLNRAINSGEYALIRPWFGFLKLFTTALEKLPSVKSIIWRGVHNNVVKYYKENEEITWWNVSSCSYSITSIRRRLDEDSTLCSIEALNGKEIRRFACDTSEDEVLLLPGTRLRVKSRNLDRSTGNYIIHLEEMTSDNSKTPASTQTSLSPTSKSSGTELRSHNSTQPYVSTAYMTLDKPLADKDESTIHKVFSITTFLNGARYETADKGGEKERYGIYYDAHGKKDESCYAYLRANGDGFCISSNGDRYEGTFRDNKMNGYGSLFRADQYTYVGQWIADEAYGKGTSTWSNGNRYEGYHEKGKITGSGTFYSDNGDKYQGNLDDGKAHGYGERTWLNGDRYKGSFRNDKKHGDGTYSYAGGGKYIGQWINDEMDGQGSLKWPSGARYEGGFKNGKKHGWGKLTFANGQVQDGKWENDKYIA